MRVMPSWTPLFLFLDEHYMYDYQVSTKQKITLQMYELYNEKLTDLLRVPIGNVKTLKTGYAPDTGSYVKVSNYVQHCESGGFFACFRKGKIVLRYTYMDSQKNMK